MLKWFLRQRHSARKRIVADAAELLRLMPDLAYTTARERSRQCERRGDRTGERHWTRVALVIARRTGKVVGQKVADRYETDRHLVVDPHRREIAEALTDIAEAIAYLARGRENDTTLHNAEAAVHRLTGHHPKAVEVGNDLRRALRDLASTPAESAAALAADVYPPRAETAGQALGRFRAAVLPSGRH